MDIKLFLKSCFSSACCIKSFSKVCFSPSLLDTLPFPLLCCLFHGPPLLFLFLWFISNKLTVNFWAFVFFVWEGEDHLKLPRNCPELGFMLYSVIANKINWTWSLSWRWFFFFLGRPNSLGNTLQRCQSCFPLEWKIHSTWESSPPPYPTGQGGRGRTLQRQPEWPGGTPLLLLVA